MDGKNISASVAKKLNVDIRTVNDLNAAFAEALKDCAVQLDSVSIPGFGTFNSYKHSEKVVVEDGKRRLIPPSIELAFRPSVLLRKHLFHNE